jgi:hypothetical protein
MLREPKTENFSTQTSNEMSPIYPARKIWRISTGKAMERANTAVETIPRSEMLWPCPKFKPLMDCRFRVEKASKIAEKRPTGEISTASDACIANGVSTVYKKGCKGIGCFTRSLRGKAGGASGTGVRYLSRLAAAARTWIGHVRPRPGKVETRGTGGPGFRPGPAATAAPTRIRVSTPHLPGCRVPTSRPTAPAARRADGHRPHWAVNGPGPEVGRTRGPAHGPGPIRGELRPAAVADCQQAVGVVPGPVADSEIPAARWPPYNRLGNRCGPPAAVQCEDASGDQGAPGPPPG